MEVFATCPPLRDQAPGAYLESVEAAARWSDDAGCDGILVYTDNRLLDPWIVSDVILRVTRDLMPLVAVQPLYLHPYAAAKMVATFAHLYERRVCLNMVAGGFRNDLIALDDHVDHDDRYDRIVEFTQIVTSLTDGEHHLTYEGAYYSVANLSLTPPVPVNLRPRIFVSGSSAAGALAAQKIQATAVRYPQPSEGETGGTIDGLHCGIRVGIIARETSLEAWEVAYGRFPPDRRGQIAHELAMGVSDSRWHRTLSDLGATPPSDLHPYWLGPFQNHKTYCPYLVGSYAAVAEELARYLALGFETVILDVPASPEELTHTRVAMEMSVERSGMGQRGPA